MSIKNNLLARLLQTLPIKLSDFITNVTSLTPKGRGKYLKYVLLKQKVSDHNAFGFMVIVFKYGKYFITNKRVE